MIQNRKQLKTSSIVVLIFAALTLIKIIADVWYMDFSIVEIPEGLPDNTIMIVKIIFAAISFVCLLPQVYIGCKGLKMAKAPDSSRAHIVWGTILLVFAVIGLFSPAFAIIKQEEVSENVSTLFSVLLEVIVFYEYVKYARLVQKGE